jgi:predicted neuraminidase
MIEMKRNMAKSNLNFHCFFCILLFIGSVFTTSETLGQNPDKSVITKEDIFTESKDFKECHASTLVHLKDGTFLTAWFGGTKEKNPDVGIWMSKGVPGNWGAPFQVTKISGDAHWNPVLFESPQGKIYLFFKVGKEITAWETWVKTSDDQGKTWSDAYELVPGDKGGRGPVRNKPIVLSNGTWVTGSSFENAVTKKWDAFTDRSDDNGKTWTATPYIAINRDDFKGAGVIQPTLWESKPGMVHMLLRSTAGVICRSDSKDYGKTWSTIYKTDLPNPNSGIDLTKLPNGTLALLYNPDNKNWGSRGNLNLAISYDNGLTWQKKFIIEEGDPKDEHSYPAIINYGTSVAYTYTDNRKKIAFGTVMGILP